MEFKSIKNIASALAKFQGKITNPKESANNSFLNSKYAPLSEVLNTVRPVLSENGLSLIQTPLSSEDGERVGIQSTLLHESGEFLEFPTVFCKIPRKANDSESKKEKSDAQEIGSIISYLRRYALSSILGISSEEDTDGASKKSTIKMNDLRSEKKYAVSIPSYQFKCAKCEGEISREQYLTSMQKNKQPLCERHQELKNAA